MGTGTPGRTDQQGIFRPGRERIVSILRSSHFLGRVERWAQSHAICDEYQTGQWRGESTVVSAILLADVSYELTIRIKNWGTHSGGCSLSRVQRPDRVVLSQGIESLTEV